MKPSDCFTQIPADTSKLVELCMQSIQDADPSEWQQDQGFKNLSIPLDQVVESSQVLFDINSRIKICWAGISRFMPYEYYHLHTDVVRGVGINMLLKHEHSHCIFVGLANKKCTLPMIELCYEPGVMYLFNTQMPHTISNFTGERYMFTLQFQEPKQVLKYADVVRHLKSLQKKSQS
jgi:hypothetical protein